MTRASVFLIACCLCASMSSADEGPAPPGALEISVGAGWIAGVPMGSRAAALTGASGQPFALFTATTELGGGPRLDVRIGRRLARAIEVEAAGSFAPRTLRVSVSEDFEQAAPAAAAVGVHEFTVEGGALVEPARWRARARVRAFAAAGGGYVRQLYEAGVLARTGRLAYAGGGARVPLSVRSGSRRLERIGVRADVRAVIRSAGVAIDGRSHVAPSVAVAFYMRF